MREMRSIIDDKAVGTFLVFVDRLLKKSGSSFFNKAFVAKLRMEIASNEEQATKDKELFFDLLDDQLRKATSKIDYRISKSDRYISTIRHGLKLLRRNEQREKITADIINEKTVSNIDNDMFAERFNAFLATISDEEITKQILFSIDQVGDLKKAGTDAEELKQAVDLYSFSLDECFDELKKMAKSQGMENDYEEVMKQLRLYNVEQMVLISSDYGVPQNRERVVFIGSRNDQEPIKEIPATVKKEDRVTVYEAISDLDYIGNGEVSTSYGTPPTNPKYDGLIRKRKVDGEFAEDGEAKTFACFGFCCC